ncbi:MAG: RNA 2',3'-cyclic phosphodiesterase [Bacteroidetes bacterium]|nr:MAG: RNA 2',3'-cyclic phosphodiesterase [Bacteroidota bacterium]
MQGTKLYFIAILMPPEIANSVITIKEEFAARFKSRHALKTPPHVTLQAPFYMSEKEEVEFRQQLSVFFERIPPFFLQFNNFASFKKKKFPVIYINPDKNEELEVIHEDLMYFLRELNFPEEQTRISFHPHMTIANRDLTGDQFEAAWPEFENRIFHAKFRVRQVHLLRHDGEKWEPVAYFKLGG